MCFFVKFNEFLVLVIRIGELANNVSVAVDDLVKLPVGFVAVHARLSMARLSTMRLTPVSRSRLCPYPRNRSVVSPKRVRELQILMGP